MEMDMKGIFTVALLDCWPVVTKTVAQRSPMILRFCTQKKSGANNTYEDVDSQSSGRIEVQLIVDLPNTRDLAYIGNQNYTLQNPTIGSGELIATSNALD